MDDPFEFCGGVGDAVGVLMFLSIAVSPGNGHGGDVKFGSAGDVVDAVANHENIRTLVQPHIVQNVRDHVAFASPTTVWTRRGTDEREKLCEFVVFEYLLGDGLGF